MTTTRKQYSAKFKARVAIEAIRGEKTLNQLGSHFGVHPVQVAQWRRAALEQLEEIFVDGRRRKDRAEEVEKEALYEEIGLAEKKSWLARMRTGGGGWSPSIPA
jgi:transposase-like protein